MRGIEKKGTLSDGKKMSERWRGSGDGEGVRDGEGE